MKRITLILMFLACFIQCTTEKPEIIIPDGPESRPVEKAETSDEQTDAEEPFELHGWYKMGVEFYNKSDNPPSAAGPWQIYKYLYVDETACQLYFYVDIFTEYWNADVPPYYCFTMTDAGSWYVNLQSQSVETNIWGEEKTYEIISSSKETLYVGLDEKKMGKLVRSNDEARHALFENATPMTADEVHVFLNGLYSDSLE